MMSEIEHRNNKIKTQSKANERREKLTKTKAFCKRLLTFKQIATMRSRSTILKITCLALSLSYIVSMTAEARRGLYRIRLNTDNEFAASTTTISSPTRESKQTKVVSTLNEQHTMFEENSRA